MFLHVKNRNTWFAVVSPFVQQMVLYDPIARNHTDDKQVAGTKRDIANTNTREWKQ
jgi:hypothetical protein